MAQNSGRKKSWFVDHLYLASRPGRPGRPSVEGEEQDRASNYIKFDENKATVVLKGSRLA